MSSNKLVFIKKSSKSGVKMVRIINGEIVQDNDPRLQKQSEVSSSGTRVTGMGSIRSGGDANRRATTAVIVR
jgi:hypothetical protein